MSVRLSSCSWRLSRCHLRCHRRCHQRCHQRLGWGHDSRDRAKFDTGEMAGAAAVAGRSGARGAIRALPGGLPAPARRALADPARCHARRRHPAAAAADFQVFGAWVSLRPGQGDLCGQAAALRAGWGRTQHASCKDHRWRPSVPCAGKIAAWIVGSADVQLHSRCQSAQILAALLEMDSSCRLHSQELNKNGVSVLEFSCPRPQQHEHCSLHAAARSTRQATMPA